MKTAFISLLFLAMVACKTETRTDSGTSIVLFDDANYKYVIERVRTGVFSRVDFTGFARWTDSLASGVENRWHRWHSLKIYRCENVRENSNTEVCKSAANKTTILPYANILEIYSSAVANAKKEIAEKMATEHQVHIDEINPILVDIQEKEAEVQTKEEALTAARDLIDKKLKPKAEQVEKDSEKLLKQYEDELELITNILADTEAFEGTELGDALGVFDGSSEERRLELENLIVDLEVVIAAAHKYRTTKTDVHMSEVETNTTNAINGIRKMIAQQQSAIDASKARYEQAEDRLLNSEADSIGLLDDDLDLVDEIFDQAEEGIYNYDKSQILEQYQEAQDDENHLFYPIVVAILEISTAD